MQLRYYWRKMLSQPPRRTARKAALLLQRGLKRWCQRQHDQHYATYLLHHDLAAYCLQRRFPALPEDRLASQIATLAELTQRYLDHQFDLLGSGWVPVRHGQPCRGVEGCRYASGAALRADGAGAWLAGRINAANLPEAQRIWQAIEPPYTPIDWQLDFKSGYRWRENQWYHDVRYGHRPGVDVKVPWELARMQHLPQFALAHALASQGQAGFAEPAVYVRAFRNQVLDFLATNPPRFGVNWRCTMDVAIRAVNWLIGRDLFLAAGACFDTTFERLFLRGILEHGSFIWNNLEWDPYLRTNHYLANVVGLIFVGGYLAPAPLAERWLTFGWRELLRETATQFGPDGGHFEASINYHRLCADMVFWAVALRQTLPPARRPPLPAWFVERLGRMAYFTEQTTRPDGTPVQIGDNDSGCLVRLSPSWVRAAVPPQPQPSPCAPASCQVAFPDFGLYVYRTAHYHLFLRCGPVGQNGCGGHAHNDQLSLELAVGRRSVIVDPGSYLYTPSPQQRNRFRATASHNTLVVPGREQNDWQPGQLGLFALRRVGRSRVLVARPDCWIAEHDGFGPPHRRALRLAPQRIDGTDSCSLPGWRYLAFHLAPGLPAPVLDGATACLDLGTGQRVCLATPTPGARWNVVEDAYSPGYGCWQPAYCLQLHHAGPDIHWYILIEEHA